jgi:hypothetical protein
MDNQWKNENCGNCEFNIMSQCRKNPPAPILKWRHVYPTAEYPDIHDNTPACSLWRQKETSDLYNSQGDISVFSHLGETEN